MTVVLDKLTDVQTGVVDTISSVKEPVVKGVSTVVDFVVERLPQIPAVPYAEQIPTPVELVNNQYKFAKSLIDTNKDIALAVAKAVAPITDKALDRKAPRTIAPKTTARKTTAKKAS